MSLDSRFTSLERDQEDDQAPGHHTVYKWEQGTSAWNDGVGIADDEDLLGKELQSYRALERERLKKAKLRRITPSIRRGLIRFLFIALDCSSSAEVQDYRPSTRFQVCKDMIQKFIHDYYDQNPISQLGLLVTRNRLAERMTDLSGNPSVHTQKLQKLMNTAGLASLQNTITLAISLLQHVPTYGQRELLIVYNSISTCDPGDIFTTINQAIQQKIKIHVISLAGEIYICRKITELTGGSFQVALDSTHLQEIFLSFTVPPPSTTSNLASDDLYTDFVYLGFPTKTFQGVASFCLNQDNVSLAATSYTCPRCHTRTSELPTDCKVCSLQLNSSANIARSYHHLFPVTNYNEVTNTNTNITTTATTTTTAIVNTKVIDEKNEDVESCKGCLLQFLDRNVKMQCPSCNHLFCVDCDLFIHESLHNCPGCSL